MPRKDINALEAGHRRKPWSPAQDRFDMRAALRATPDNLFAALHTAMADNTPHAQDMRKIIAAEQKARYRRYLRSNSD